MKKKTDTPEEQPHVILEVEKPQKSDIRTEINGPHNYNTRSRNKRVNHVTTFKTAPNMFKMDVTDRKTTHIGTYYLARIDPKKDTITMQPIAIYINCKTTGKY